MNVALADLDHVTQDNARMAHDYAQSADAWTAARGCCGARWMFFGFNTYDSCHRLYINNFMALIA